jgi:hypothetical protein
VYDLISRSFIEVPLDKDNYQQEDHEPYGEMQDQRMEPSGYLQPSRQVNLIFNKQQKN